MGEISNDEDLGLDLAGGRDDPVLPGDSPVYIASITKGSAVDGKLKVNNPLQGLVLWYAVLFRSMTASFE